MSEDKKTTTRKRRPKGEIKYKITLDADQKEAKRLIIENEIVIITGRAGCLGYGTKVLMYDGSFKEVQDVQVGDQLMGVDSKPRNVLNLCRGREQMYWIRQNKGMDYRVNESHILSLRHNDKILNISVKDYLDNKIKKEYKGYVSGCINFKHKEVSIDPYFLGLYLGDGSVSNKSITNTDKEVIEYIEKYLSSLNMNIVNRDMGYFPTSKFTISEKKISDIISIHELVQKGYSISSAYKSHFKTNTMKHDFYRLYRKHKNLVEHYKKQNLNEDVDNKNKLFYLFESYGLKKDKFIPKDYLINSEEIRLAVLAGLIDSDGYKSKEGKYYEIVQKDKRISEDIAYLCRSLGFKVNIRVKKATLKREGKDEYKCDVYRITIMGNDLHRVPCKVQRKIIKYGEISNFKNRLNTGITIEKDTIDDYYGFELDGDHLFLLEDFTVTHNTGKSAVTAQTALDLLFKRELDKILITRPTVEVGRTLGLLPGSISEKVNPYLEPFFESLYSCYDEGKVKKHIENTNIIGKALQFIRGNNFYDKSLNILEEAQNTTKAEMLSFLTRLNKGARIVIVGDLDQQDTRESYTGLHYAIELSNKIQEIKHIKLKNNHRSDLVGKILDYEYEI